MLDREQARLWAQAPDFRQALERWGWFRQAIARALDQAAAHAGCDARVRPEALAAAFWAWQASLEPDRPFEARNPLDFAHFACGLLLQHLLQQQPLRLPDDAPPAPARREAAARALTRVALTVLCAWRQALQAPPLDAGGGEIAPRLWNSYLENTRDEPGLAIAFLDLFAGRAPVWDAPHTVALRPGMQQARPASA